MKITNATRGSTLADTATLANSIWSRFLGLMGRRQLPAGSGLVLLPNNSVHMFFMRFALDIVFVDRAGKVLGLREGLRPWVGLAVCWPAHLTLELPVGTIAASKTTLGDTLEFSPPVL